MVNVFNIAELSLHFPLSTLASTRMPVCVRARACVSSCACHEQITRLTKGKMAGGLCHQNNLTICEGNDDANVTSVFVCIYQYMV